MVAPRRCAESCTLRATTNRRLAAMQRNRESMERKGHQTKKYLVPFSSVLRGSRVSFLSFSEKGVFENGDFGKKVSKTKCNGNLEPTWLRALLVGAATGPGR